MLRPLRAAGLPVERHEERGPPEPLDHARRNDADHPGMPCVAGEHEAGRVRATLLLHLRQRLLEHLLVERLALGVEHLEARCDGGRFLRIVGEQQPQAFHRLADAAGGVEPRTDDEAHLPGAEFLAQELGGAEQRTEPGPPRVGHEPQAMPHDDAVLAHKRYDVGHRGERDQVEQVQREVFRQAEARCQRADHHPRDARAAEHAQPRLVVLALRIDHGGGGRKLRSGKVVVGDDDPDAARLRQPHRLVRVDAAVAGDDQPRAGGFRRREAGRDRSRSRRAAGAG